MERIHNTKQKFQFLKIFDFYKILQNKYRNYKNMNYGTCRECKIKIWVFEIFQNISKKIRFFRQCFGFFGVFVKGIVIFNIGFGFCVLNSIYRHGLKIFFDSKKSKKSTPQNRNKSQKCEQFSYETFGGIFLRRFTRDPVQHGRLIYTYTYTYIYIYIYIKKNIYIYKTTMLDRSRVNLSY